MEETPKKVDPNFGNCAQEVKQMIEQRVQSPPKRPVSAPPNFDSNFLFLYQEDDMYTRNFAQGFLPDRMQNFYTDFYESKNASDKQDNKQAIPPPMSNEELSFLQEYKHLKTNNNPQLIRKLSTISSVDEEGGGVNSPLSGLLANRKRTLSNLSNISHDRRILENIVKGIEDLEMSEEIREEEENKDSTPPRDKQLSEQFTVGFMERVSNLDGEEIKNEEKIYNVNSINSEDIPPPPGFRGLGEAEGSGHIKIEVGGNISKSRRTAPSGALPWEVERYKGRSQTPGRNMKCIRNLMGEKTPPPRATPQFTFTPTGQNMRISPISPPPGLPLFPKETDQVPRSIPAPPGLPPLPGASPNSLIYTSSGGLPAPIFIHDSLPLSNSTSVALQGEDNLNISEGGDKELDIECTKLIDDTFRLTRDQAGCRQLQGKLDENNPLFAHALFNKLLPKLTEHMRDAFGNYLCQKLFECISRESLTMTLQLVRPVVESLANNLHGTRAIQKLIEQGTLEHHPQNIRSQALSLIQTHVCSLVRDVNGNHVIQQCLVLIPNPIENQFIYNEVMQNCFQISSHKHGCCVMQKCIDHASQKQKAELVDVIIGLTHRLVPDMYGNYVIQYVIELKDLDVNQRLSAMLLGTIILLSSEKFSSNVIEKSLEINTPLGKERIIAEILECESYLPLLVNQYGNYVIQKALGEAKEPQYSALIKKLQPEIPELKKSNEFGRKICSKLVKNHPSLQEFKYSNNVYMGYVRGKGKKGKKEKRGVMREGYYGEGYNEGLQHLGYEGGLGMEMHHHHPPAEDIYLPMYMEGGNQMGLGYQGGHPGHIEHIGNIEHSGHIEHIEHIGHIGHIGHPGHPGHSEHLGHPGHPGHSGHPGHPGHSGHSGHSEHLGHSGHPGHPGHPGHSGHPGHPGHQVHQVHQAPSPQAQGHLHPHPLLGNPNQYQYYQFHQQGEKYPSNYYGGPMGPPPPYSGY